MGAWETERGRGGEGIKVGEKGERKRRRENERGEGRKEGENGERNKKEKGKRRWEKGEIKGEMGYSGWGDGKRHPRSHPHPPIMI